jgi:hypothetical protein
VRHVTGTHLPSTFAYCVPEPPHVGQRLGGFRGGLAIHDTARLVGLSTFQPPRSAQLRTVS